MTRHKHSKRALQVLAPAVLALAVTGCMRDPAFTGSATMPYDATQRHPIYLETSQAVVEIATGSQTHLDSAQAVQVDAFAQAYRREGERTVYVQAPSGAVNDATATALVAPIRHRLISSGVAPSNIVYQTYDATGMRDAPIRLSYQTLEAKAGPCGLWPTSISHSPNNNSWYNMGCAYQNNLAQMVVNKRDLITQRDSDPVDAARRSTVIDRYRRGEATQSDTSSTAVNLSDTRSN